MNALFLFKFALILLLHEAQACTLCPLRVPPRPRPLNQYKLPVLPDFDIEQLPKFCSIAHEMNVDPQCRRGFESIFCTVDNALEKCPGSENAEKCSSCTHIKEQGKWIIKWIDSLGKPGAGISDGNYYWLGDYETCQSLRVSQDFRGKYCRVTLEVPDSLVEEGCTQTDPLAINIGVCFPSSCSADSLANITKSISPYELQVDCEFDVNWNSTAYILIALCAIWLGALILITLIPLKHNSSFYHLLHSFSIKANAKKALSTKRIRTDGLHALHGVEFLAFMWIITGNVYNYMMPYIENVAFSFDGVYSPSMHLTNNYSYQVDGLFALSALYTTFLVYGSLKSWKDVGTVILYRFVRFWPAYVFCVLFMMFIFSGISSGPMWIHSDTVERCENNWWKNILFINNFYDVRSTCVDFGSIMSLEAQFFVILVVLIYVARSHFMYTMIGSAVMLAASCIFSFIYIYINELPPVAILTTEPIPEKKINGILIFMQSLFYRAPSYLIGFIYGVFIKTRKASSLQSSLSAEEVDEAQLPEPKGLLEQYLSKVITILSIIFTIFVLFALLPYASRNVGSHLFLSFYGAIHRPLWAFSLLSFLYLGEQGYFSWITAILSWRIFSPLSKLTWIALIVAEPVILYFFTSLSRPSYATHWSMVYSAISAATMSYLIAFLIDIFLTRPIRTLLFPEEKMHPVGDENGSRAFKVLLRKSETTADL